MEPQINADERRFVDPDLKNFLDFSSETIVILKNLIYKTHLFNTSSSAMNLSAFICVHPRLNFYLDPSSFNFLQYCDLMDRKI